MSGFDVDTAGNGRQAMDVLAHAPRPDVVVLDMRMPQLDGPSTVFSIRRSPVLHDLRVFAVSGTPQSEVAVTLGADGVDRWFAKPLNPAKLVDAMHHDLGTQRV
jgi:CheY-like chemotaxis protein